MRDNVITAVWNSTGRYKTSPLYQYDYGQKLVISGVELPSAYEVHFANTVHGNATTQIGNADGVSIPDMYLLSGQTVYAWLFVHSGESDGETEFVITIPVIARAKPTDQQPTPVQQSAIDEAILALQQALYEAGVTVSHYPQVGQDGYWYTWDTANGEWVSTGVQAQGEQGVQGERGPKGDTGATGPAGPSGSTGPQGIKGDKGDTGPRGESGTTFTPAINDGVLSWTNNGGAVNPDPVTIKGDKGDTGSTGPAGADGNDGYSPTATVEKFGDTAVITITDKNGTTTATVTDGTTPTAHVTDVQVNGTSILNNGVANIPKAASSTFGLIKTGSANGIYVNADGEAYVACAPSSQIKAGENMYRPITPFKQHESTFYGLAKSAGDSTQSASKNAVGTYTETALSKISDMLNAPVSVSGSTPSITAKSGVQYVCGECSTLSVTAPASGCIDVRFTSGSTATVLTVTSAKTGVTAIKWANGFDPTSLDANTVYEINILDGEYGVAAAWT